MGVFCNLELTEVHPLCDTFVSLLPKCSYSLAPTLFCFEVKSHKLMHKWNKKTGELVSQVYRIEFAGKLGKGQQKGKVSTEV